MAVGLDSSGVEAALVAYLQADAELSTLLPDGIFVDLAPQGAERFGIVSRMPSGGGDVATFGQREIEDYEFLIKAIVRVTNPTVSTVAVRAAAVRLEQLLEDHAISVPGYEWMTTHRTTFVRVTEVDDVDAALRWLHRGGQYRLQYSRAD